MPSKHERSECNLARDEYFSCLDKTGYKDDIQLLMRDSLLNPFTYKEEEKKPLTVHNNKEPAECLKLKELFNKKCPASWVKHFTQLRQRDQVVQELKKQGAKPL